MMSQFGKAYRFPLAVLGSSNSGPIERKAAVKKRPIQDSREQEWKPGAKAIQRWPVQYRQELELGCDLVECIAIPPQRRYPAKQYTDGSANKVKRSTGKNTRDGLTRGGVALLLRPSSVCICLRSGSCPMRARRHLVQNPPVLFNNIFDNGRQINRLGCESLKL